MTGTQDFKMKKETFKAGLRRRYLAVFDEVKAKTGMTEKDLCQATGIHASYIHQIRSGKRSPTLEQVMSICDKYNYDLLYVLRGDDKVHVKRPADNVTLEQVYKELQELREIQDSQFEKMLEALIILKNKFNPIDPKEWINKIGNS